MRTFASTRAELEHVILQLATVSHVSAMSLEPSVRSAEEDIGGKRPPGGMDHTGDHQVEFRQKSAMHFMRRLRGTPEHRLSDLLTEAYEALWAWRHTPDVDGTREVEPERGSFLWKCRIADDQRPLERIKGEFLVSKATVYRYRQTYRGLRAPQRDAA